MRELAEGGPLRTHDGENSRVEVVRGERLLESIPTGAVSPEALERMRLVMRVLPFKVNNYVLTQLISWADVPNDPIFRLTFPDGDMLPPGILERLADPNSGVDSAITAARAHLDPDPGSQQDNVPTQQERPLRGLQHKYPNTVLVFPSTSQTCHTICGYCFRWPQFIGMEQRHSLADPQIAVSYLRRHPEVTDVVLTGGDPMVMQAAVLQRWIDPIIDNCPTIRNIRIGTKALSYWPHRFVTDPDSGQLLDLLGAVVGSGRSLSLMAHISHPRELSKSIVVEAVSELRRVGATIRTQAPVVRGVNDEADVWAEMWTRQVELGMVPYYMFVARPTGAHRYYALPLARALSVFQGAMVQVSGLARTVRGPVMSFDQGKLMMEGIITIGDRRLFVGRMIQARTAELSGAFRFYGWDPEAAWIDELQEVQLANSCRA